MVLKYRVWENYDVTTVREYFSILVMKDFIRTVHSATHKSYEQTLEITVELILMYLGNHTYLL